MVPEVLSKDSRTFPSERKEQEVSKFRKKRLWKWSIPWFEAQPQSLWLASTSWGIWVIRFSLWPWNFELFAWSRLAVTRVGGSGIWDSLFTYGFQQLLGDLVEQDEVPGSATPRRLRMHCAALEGMWRNGWKELEWFRKTKTFSAWEDEARLAYSQIITLDSLWEILYPFIRGLSHDLDAFVHPSAGF